MSDTIQPHLLPDDMCALAENVEFFFSSLGERRSGCTPFDLTGSSLDDEDTIVHLSQRFPTNNIKEAELWALGATPGSSTTLERYTAVSGWVAVTPDDPILDDAPNIYDIVSQQLHGKFFFAYPSDENRMHVWDGTYFRRAGLAQPDVPVVATEGSGLYIEVRYFRVRYIDKDGTGVIHRRSEPSENVTFTPPGTGAGATITRPALLGEHETHWEVEASFNGADFYAIATLPIATLTYNDELDFTTDDYADHGLLSEDIGTYLLLPSARFVAADADRLLLGGHWTDRDLQSRVMWTPVFNDPGVGNDERLPLAFDNYIDLDNYDGGALTGISQVVNGSWYAFKWGHIYKLVRTGEAQSAYDVIVISKSRGAIPGSIVSGMDEAGRPAIYFLDPVVGPSRISGSGLQVIQGLRQTWRTVNLAAEGIIARGVYYPDKQQVHWWVATEGADFPNLKFVLQVSEVQTSSSETLRGWSLATGHIAEAKSVTILNTLDTDGTLTSLSERPYIGMDSPDFIQQCDVGDDDAGVDYVAKIRTRSYLATGILNWWGAMKAGILASPNEDAHIRIKFIRDYGLESNQIETDLAPAADEELVIKLFDDLVMSNSHSIQVEFSDLY